MLDQSKNIFIVGIKGVAMANIAMILKKMGKNVTGSDIAEEFITDGQLKQHGIYSQIGFAPDKLPGDTNLVIYTGANQGVNNPQVKEAKKRGVNIITQAEFLAQLSSQFKTTIAVCGCHGKTTTSSLLSYALIKLGAKPSYMVGSSSFNDFPGGDFKGKDYFVIEADEYGVNPPLDKTPKFHYLKPDYILCTNIDFDHPDVYKNLKETQNAFLKFFDNKKLILCADDPITLQSINLPAGRQGRLNDKQYITYGFSKKSHLQIGDYKTERKGSSFSLHFNQRGNKSLQQSPISRMAIKLYGDKNVLNAAGVILTLLQLGFPFEKIKTAIQDFTGAKRRFEQIFEKNGTYLFDDYGHHPREIEATIQAARSRFPKRRIIIIFQPHTYSRTQVFLKDFAASLSLANRSFILPIFPSARENPNDFNVTSNDVAKISQDKIVNVTSKKLLLSHLTTEVSRSDIIFTMGAGDIYKLKDDIINIIKAL